MSGYDAVTSRKANVAQDVLSEIEGLKDEIRRVYLADPRPWVVGYSGGKDSTATLRLVYEALSELESSRRTKDVFVVSSDTLVETPVVSGLVAKTLEKVVTAAASVGLPIRSRQVYPNSENTFWANLIGKGYPAPTRQFRWCTERMKIDPVSEFIKEKVATFGEVVVILGSRSLESASRAQVMKKHRIEGKRLSRHTTLPNAYVYTPIETWTADSVWEYLFSGPAPWGGDHQALFDLYKDSNAGECPLVIDKSTPSCGNSRFGCWTCTVVTQDRAIDGLIQSGHNWMVPLKEFRDQLYQSTLPENKHRLRQTRRRDGRVTVVVDEQGVEKHIPGAYRMEVRQNFLKELLEAQRKVDAAGLPERVELISKDEMEAIRNEWRNDPNEPDWEDSVPRIFREVMGKDLDWRRNDDALFSGEDAQRIREVAQANELQPELVMKLLEFELSMAGLSRRSQVTNRITEILGKDWGDTDEDLAGRAKKSTTLKDREIQEKDLFELYSQLERLQNHAA
jgi:DNA sulfur modification protein DndC